MAAAAIHAPRLGRIHRRRRTTARPRVLYDMRQLRGGGRGNVTGVNVQTWRDGSLRWSPAA